jgi:hypothetical protein
VSLRKSPTRTPAFLAANRANAKKSTGPRTPEGKARVALSQLRHGGRSPGFVAHFAQSPHDYAEFAGIFRALCQAILPVNETEEWRVARTAVNVWAAKRNIERWAASPAERQAFFARTQGVFPAPWRLKIKRPGWWVTITVWVGRGRCAASDGFPRRVGLVGGGWQEGQARLHTVVTVTSSMRHPLWGYQSLEEVPEGAAPRVTFAVKPESGTKHEAGGGASPVAISVAASPGARCNGGVTVGKLATDTPKYELVHRLRAKWVDGKCRITDEGLVPAKPRPKPALDLEALLRKPESHTKHEVNLTPLAIAELDEKAWLANFVDGFLKKHRRATKKEAQSIAD